MSGGSDVLLDDVERRPMQLGLDAGLHLGALLSFRDLYSVCTARLVLATLPELLAASCSSLEGAFRCPGLREVAPSSAASAARERGARPCRRCRCCWL